MDNRITAILNEITEALGDSARMFIIEHSETLVDEGDEIGVLVSFTPRQDLDFEDGQVKAESQYLEFYRHADGEVCMITGEDTEHGVTSASIYACLYWGAVVKPLSEILDEAG